MRPCPPPRFRHRIGWVSAQLPRAAPASRSSAARRRIAALYLQALDGLPLVAFCRPSSWRDQLEQVARQRGVQLNVVLEADSLALQLGIASQGGAYALLGSYAIDVARSQHRFQAARLVDPPIVRHIALALARTGPLSPATRAVMQESLALAQEMSLDPARVAPGVTAAGRSKASSRG